MEGSPYSTQALNNTHNRSQNLSQRNTLRTSAEIWQLPIDLLFFKEDIPSAISSSVKKCDPAGSLQLATDSCVIGILSGFNKSL